MIAHSTLFQTLKKLNTKDRKRLGQLVASPFFNQRPELIRLYAVLNDAIEQAAVSVNRPQIAKMDDQQVWEQVFLEPNAAKKAATPPPFDDKKLRYMLSWLLELVRQFIRQEALQSEPHMADLLLQKGLYKREMTELLQKEHQQHRSALAANTQQDGAWYWHDYQHKQLALDMAIVGNRTQMPDMVPIQQSITTYYLIEMLRHTIASLTNGSILAATPAQNFDHIFALIHTYPTLAETPAIAVYHSACQLLLAPPDSETEFETWKTTITQHQSAISSAELRNIYLLGINFCIKRMNSGKKLYIREAFTLYQTAIAADLLRENGWITAHTYKNIIRIGTALEEHAWTEWFSESQRLSLHPRERDDMYHYNRAYLLFHKQEYDKAMPLLQRINLQDTLNNLDARRMLARSYYQLREYQALESLLVSFQAYVKRQKNTGYHAEMYLNFIAQLRRVLQLEHMTSAQKTKLRAEIEQINPIADKVWLLSLCGE
jgi:hypothetical protein